MRATAALLLGATALAACQRPVPPQVLQPVPPPLGPTAPVVAAEKLQAAPGDWAHGLADSTRCNLEGTAGGRFGAAPAKLYRRAPAQLSGWAVLEAAPPTRLRLIVLSAADAKRAWQVELPVDIEREDVATHFQSPALLRSGFAAHVDFSALPAGDYRLLLAYGDGAQQYRCDNDRRVQLGD